MINCKAKVFEMIDSIFCKFVEMKNNQKYTVKTLIMFVVVLCLLVSSSNAGDTYLSPNAMTVSADKSVIYIAEESAGKVAVLDVATESVVDEIVMPFSGFPSGLTLSADGSVLFVTVSEAEEKVYAFDTASKDLIDTYEVGHNPLSPVLSKDGSELYVCNRFDNSVSIVNLASKARAEIDVDREPVASAITPDGGTLLVVNLLPTGAATQTQTGARVSVIDLDSKALGTSIRLSNGATNVQGICISPDGGYAYITHLLAKYHIPTNQIERGWIYSNVLSIIDIESMSLANTILLDDLDLGAANPIDVECTQDGNFICITHSGSHELTVIDRTKLHEKLEGKTIDEVINDFGFSVLFRRRLSLKGNGPRGLVLIGTKAYSAEYFSGSLGVVDIDPAVRPKSRSISLGTEPKLSDVRKGQMLFYDGQYCFQKWLSCASCHPDARSDALNWDVLNDGFGNAKQTKSLLLSHQTPPTTITGCRADAEISVRAGLKYVYFAVRPETDAIAIDEFLKLLRPAPSPYLVEGQLSEAATRGREIFEGSAACASCHVPSTHYTDMKLHDVGTGFGRHAGTNFDTPTLSEAWRTAPYLYRGQAATMEDVLTTFNPNDKHGTTSNLSPQQISDLAEYVLSIGN